MTAKVIKIWIFLDLGDGNGIFQVKSEKLGVF